MRKKELKDLAGKHILQGIELGTTKYKFEWSDRKEVNCVKFTLDGKTYMAIEDPSDGYRSYCEDLCVVKEECRTKLPDIEVVCVLRNKDEYGNTSELLEFIDCGNGKTILTVGTGNTSDYYPYCVFEYTPENMTCNKKRKVNKKPKQGIKPIDLTGRKAKCICCGKIADSDFDKLPFFRYDPEEEYDAYYCGCQGEIKH